jgi:alpha-N-acetylglucosamine transferase
MEPSLFHLLRLTLVILLSISTLLVVLLLTLHGIKTLIRKYKHEHRQK